MKKSIVDQELIDVQKMLATKQILPHVLKRYGTKVGCYWQPLSWLKFVSKLILNMSMTYFKHHYVRKSYINSPPSSIVTIQPFFLLSCNSYFLLIRIATSLYLSSNTLHITIDLFLGTLLFVVLLFRQFLPLLYRHIRHPNLSLAVTPIIAYFPSIWPKVWYIYLSSFRPYSFT